MIDSVNLYLPQSELNSIDVLAEIPNYLTDLKEYTSKRGGVAVKGNLSNMQVTAKEHGLFINGSLPKYLQGHNISTSSYQDVLLAFEKLSDELRISPKALEKAIVGRVDYSATLTVNNPEVDYFAYLGEKPYFSRFVHDTSLYYNSKAKERKNQRQKLLFYSKTEELKSANNPNLKDFKNDRLFRYESSILKPTAYYKGKINVGALKDRQFHKQSINRWEKDYNGIRKLDALMKDFSMVSKPSDVNNYLLAIVARDYGIDAVMKLADDFRRHDRFEKPQYYSKVRNDLARRLEQIQLGDRHELIKELDSKIVSVAAEELERLKV
jgi:hypothetical protein